LSSGAATGELVTVLAELDLEAFDALAGEEAALVNHRDSGGERAGQLAGEDLEEDGQVPRVRPQRRRHLVEAEGRVVHRRLGV